ncbi:BnaA01g22860D [Brassica napus]|uniref:BnaA01g22860D protein n=1 Tax=Brassica napus TaxID=3708 RepID=A0A078IDY6_BRANA|nr:BnaA01g22860D [Brassica napus]
MLLRLKSARVDYEKNLKPCNKKLEDEKFDKSVPEVNGGDYNEDGREGLTCSSLMQSLGVGDVICSTSSTKYEGVKKIEVVTVFELNAYVVNSTPHVKSLTVSSSICLITNVPHFLASQVTEFCAPEKCDLTSSAVFVVFYAKISWLTNVRAAEISELMGVGVGDCRGRASGELNSVRIIAEEQQLPGAGCPLKKARTE